MLKIEVKGKEVVLFTVEEVAEKIGTKPANVRRSIRNGNIEAVQIGKRIYVHEENVPRTRADQKSYSVDEVAKKFNVSPGIVRKAIRDGIFEATKKGSRYYFSEDELEYIVYNGFEHPKGVSVQTQASDRGVSVQTRASADRATDFGKE